MRRRASPLDLTMAGVPFRRHEIAIDGCPYTTIYARSLDDAVRIAAHRFVCARRRISVRQMPDPVERV
jgi:hypothetical protein